MFINVKLKKKKRKKFFKNFFKKLFNYEKDKNNYNKDKKIIINKRITYT